MIEKNALFELESQDVEVQAFLYAINQKYGYDFSEYSFAHIKRRIIYLLNTTRTETISQLQHKTLYNKVFFENDVLSAFSVNVTQMFRDASFFMVLRNEILPMFEANGQIKVWHAGCSTGEEVYSMAILLKELGLSEITLIYATDFNQKILSMAREGRMSIDDMKVNTKNYHLSGGTKSFAEYYTIEGKSAIMNKDLLANVVFASHNLVSDAVFGEMNVIMCRNVLIYFNQNLQRRAIRLFSESLTSGGVLCLGSKENLRKEDCDQYKIFSEKEKIYIKR